MKIEFVRLRGGGFDRNGQWFPAQLTAYVDNYRVSCTGNGKGWRCACPDEDCHHLDAVADLIRPSVLEALEADDDTPFRHRLQAPPQPARHRKRVQP